MTSVSFKLFMNKNNEIVISNELLADIDVKTTIQALKSCLKKNFDFSIDSQHWAYNLNDQNNEKVNISTQSNLIFNEQKINIFNENPNFFVSSKFKLKFKTHLKKFQQKKALSGMSWRSNNILLINLNWKKRK